MCRACTTHSLLGMSPGLTCISADHFAYTLELLVTGLQAPGGDE